MAVKYVKRINYKIYDVIHENMLKYYRKISKLHNNNNEIIIKNDNNETIQVSHT